MTERFRIDVLDENNWLIQDTVTGEDANPIDGTTNVLKGLVRLLNKYYEENQMLQMYKDSVSDVLLSWSQENLTAKQLQVVIAIMEELNVGDLND